MCLRSVKISVLLVMQLVWAVLLMQGVRLVSAQMTDANGFSDSRMDVPASLPASLSPEYAGHDPVDRSQPAVRSSPIMFIENMGQFDERAHFRVWGGPGTLWLAEDGVWITLRGVQLKLTFPGANPRPRLEPFDRLDTTLSYLIGDNPAQWHADVPAWAGVRYVDLYPDVDLELSSQSGHWIWRLVCRANCQFARQNVRLRIEGADTVTIDARSAVVFATAAGTVTLPLLAVEGWPVEDSHTTPSILNPQPSTFEVIAPFSSVSPSPGPSAQAAATDRQPLVARDIPNGAYGTYLGGDDYDRGYDFVVASDGSAYVVGVTKSFDFPATAGTFDPDYNGDHDVFVAKLGADGRSLIYGTFLGGEEGDCSTSCSIAVDAAGNAYVTGDTASPDFPIIPEGYDTVHTGAGNTDIFLVKLNAGGSSLAYSTFLGGSQSDYTTDLAVDGDGNSYLVGYTDSPDFNAITPGAYDTTFNAGSDTFLVKLIPAGNGTTDLLHGTFLGGANDDYATAIAVGPDGSTYVAGYTQSSDFPTTPGVHGRNYAGASDGFVVKLNADGSTLAYATFLGGSKDDYITGLAVDDHGQAHVAGYTRSTAADGFPAMESVNPYDSTHNGEEDAFVAKLRDDGSGLLYTTFLGGGTKEYASSVALDGSGNVYVAGTVISQPNFSIAGFPTTAKAIKTTVSGTIDGFLLVVTPTGNASNDLSYGTFLGGDGADRGRDVAVDTDGNIYAVGRTTSSNFDFGTASGYDRTGPSNGKDDVFVIKVKNDDDEVESTVLMSLSAHDTAIRVPGATVITLTVQNGTAGHVVTFATTVGYLHDRDDGDLDFDAESVTRTAMVTTTTLLPGIGNSALATVTVSCMTDTVSTSVIVTTAITSTTQIANTTVQCVSAFVGVNGGGRTTVLPDESIVVPVTASLTLTDATGTTDGDVLFLGAGIVNVQYDPSVVQAAVCTTDPDDVFDIELCNVGYDSDGINPDIVRFNATSADGVSQTIHLVNIVFQAVGDPQDSTPLTVEVQSFKNISGTTIVAAGQHGQIDILKRLRDVEGDVDCDEEVSIVDALFILQYDVGMRKRGDSCPSDGENTLYWERCDTNGDGDCNVVDALFIVQCDVGINNPLCPAIVTTR